MISAVAPEPSLFGELDTYLFKEGNHFNVYEKLGAHVIRKDGVDGTYFAVWAPNATAVSVIGDFNHWNNQSHKLLPRWDGSGIWEGFIGGVGHGTLYKYFIDSHNPYACREKIDPFATYSECPPKTASIVWDLAYEWSDSDWMKNRHKNNALNAPWSVYEMHLGSWRKVPEDGSRSLSYREMAPQLAQYCRDMGYTHVEFMPVMEHPFYGSWGYQITGFFSPTARFGTPQDLMYLIDVLHQNGIGVILDWVPSHFATDGFGLSNYDGTALFEHADHRKGFHPDWGSFIFNYGRNEVKEFLISNALFWLEKYHVDGLRLDAVASMLYLDYSRREGEWIPNQYGGRENLDAIAFLQQLNHEVYTRFPDVQTIAEESTSFAKVSKPTFEGGLGFGFKWNMGWMHDTLKYFAKDPVYRKHHHNNLTFSLMYAFTENFMLSLSHDEVVHGKGSLIRKMPGHDWERFANLRLLFGYQYMMPGQKLNFMGGEFAQWNEWNHDTSLDWHLLQEERHRQFHRWVADLNHRYKSEPSMHEVNFSYEGFQWIDFMDWQQGIISFLRKSRDGHEWMLACFNFTPIPRHFYRVGVPADGFWGEALNSDAHCYGGSGVGNWGGLNADPVWSHGHPHSLNMSLPPLGMVCMKRTFPRE